MALLDFIARRAICADLAATDRDAALTELLQRLIDEGYIDKRELKPVLSGLLEREKLGSTAIGKGVAVPHCKGKRIDRIWVTFGRSREGVGFKSLDGDAVHAIFLVVYPLDRPPEYLEVMQSISRVIQNPDFRRFVLNASDAEEILGIIEEMS